MNGSDWLRRELEAQADEYALDWLRKACEDVERDPHAIQVPFPMVGRRVGRRPLDATADPDDVHEWTMDDAARTLLLVATGDRAEDELRDLYRFGDAAERRGILRALPYLPVDDRVLDIVDDAVRANDTRLIAAALGPYATRHLSDAAYQQAVLKCIFVGVPVQPLDGIPERITPDGARMVASFALERIAAGRDVPDEAWTVIDVYPPESVLQDIEAELVSPFDDRRLAAGRALAGRASTSQATRTEGRR